MNFEWAKEFLASTAVTLLDNLDGHIDFPIPNKCPSNAKTLCLTEITGEQHTMEEGKTAEGGLAENGAKIGPKNSKATPRKRGLPLSDKEIRKSERFKNKSNGFKLTTCSDRRCISCSPKPPILSAKLIKNLGTQFCKMDPANLTDEALLKKKRRSHQSARMWAWKAKMKKPWQQKEGAQEPGKALMAKMGLESCRSFIL